MTTAEDKYIIELAISRIKQKLKRIEEINVRLAEIDNEDTKKPIANQKREKIPDVS